MNLRFYKFLYYKVRPAEFSALLKKILRVKRKQIPYKGFLVDIDPVSYHGISLMDDGMYEQEMTDKIQNILKDGDVFVDVGANEGYFSIIASKIVSERGKVLIVEPQKRCMSVIISNIEINGLNNCTILPYGVSDKEGVTEMTLYPTTNTGASTMSNSFNFKTKFQFLRKLFLGKQKVYLKTLDQLLTGCESIKLAKIDIEGFEMLALQGAKELLKLKKIKNILLEVHPIALESMNFSVEKIISFLGEYGYREELISPNLYCFTIGTQ